MKVPETQRNRLEIPPVEFCLDPASDFVASFAAGLGMGDERRAAIRNAARSAMKLVLDKNQGARSEERIGVDVFESEGKLHVEVLNRGVPIFLEGSMLSGGGVTELAQGLERFSIENLGRNGQAVKLAIRLGEEASRRALPKAAEADGPIATEGMVIRDLEVGEEAKLSQLFYQVYGYDYINDFVYYPEQIRARLQDGRLISIVSALPDGRILGHVGLMKWNDSPKVYEPCLGVTHPGVKSKGLFSQIFAATMERVSQTEMSYCFFDFVTNHIYSQKLVEKFKPCPLSIFVGCQSKDTQARLEKLGMGQDPKETDRYSLLYSVIPRTPHPFGRQIVLPHNLGETVGFLLAPLNLTWVPASRFDVLPPGGEYQTHLQPTQNAVVFDCSRPGHKALDAILRDWSQLLKSGYQYAGIEVPIDAPGLGNLYDRLADNGFFIGGFIPYHHSDRLGFRFQAMGPTKVDFGEIQVFSPGAQNLLAIIRENFERTHIL
jgi:hypothetical protein